MTDPSGHLPVLLDTVLDLLSPRPGETAVDLTAGRGGHAEALARRVALGGRILLCDLDAGNLAFASERVRAVPGTELASMHGSFARADREATRLGWRADVVLADLGFASTQMDDPARGFSFQADGPLDMRLDPTRGESAADLLARIREPELADAIFELGEDPFSRRIARTIVERRSRAPLRTTQELASAVVAAYGARARDSRMHPATRTFMALRILVNDELGALRTLLLRWSRAGGRPRQDPGGCVPAAARESSASTASRTGSSSTRWPTGSAPVSASGSPASRRRRPTSSSRPIDGRGAPSSGSSGSLRKCARIADAIDGSLPMNPMARRHRVVAVRKWISAGSGQRWAS
jgi:16S rRNA (cytosine1402-N4)-methyltransferase